MASPFAALLSQSTAVKTRKGLILTGLQNDFLSPEGKLPVITSTGFLDRLPELVKDFREHGDVIWVRSHFAENRAVNQDDETGDAVVVGVPQDAPQPGHRSTPPLVRPAPSSEDTDDDPPSPSKKARLSSDACELAAPNQNTAPEAQSEATSDPDEELFLTRTANREPCCIPGTFGADYATQIKELVDTRRDLQLIKTYYSAFLSTSLLMTLRTKFVTELYICGCTTNLSLYATAVDAARHGISITLVEDCLGYRKKDRHDEAIKQLRGIMGARVMSSKEVIERLKNPSAVSDDEDDEKEDSDVAAGEDADGVAFDPLAVDSEDEGDDDLLAAPVRISHTDGRASAVHNTSLSSASSPPAAESEAKPSPTIESGEPRSARAADAANTAIDQQGPADTTGASSSGGTGETDLGGRIGRATARRSSIAEKDESLEGVTVLESPWGVAIDKEWARAEALRKPSAQSSHSGLSAISSLVGLNQATVDEYEKMMEKAKSSATQRSYAQTSEPLLGDDKKYESAGSQILFHLLPSSISETIFDTLNAEITWQKMHHQTGEVPRLVSCQGMIGEDGSMPVYRHPSDQTLPLQSWTPAVDRTRKAAEQVVGHSLNHVLIQLYRSGTDYISEHSDKTLDIAKGSSIVNVSFGAQRTMRLRTKRAAASPSNSSEVSTPAPERTTYRIPMPHNSMITMSLATNAEYLHGITADKRPQFELSDAEKAFGGQRISLTFRKISTFLTADSNQIWGQGATAQTKEDAKAVINADPVESERMVRAFGKENAAASIDWESIYGEGFDVLHLK